MNTEQSFVYFEFRDSALASGHCGLSLNWSADLPLRIGTTGSDYFDQLIDRCLRISQLRADISYLCGKGSDAESPTKAFEALTLCCAQLLTDQWKGSVANNQQRVAGCGNVDGVVAVVTLQSESLAALEELRSSLKSLKKMSDRPQLLKPRVALISGPVDEEPMIRVTKPTFAPLTKAIVNRSELKIPAAVGYPLLALVARYYSCRGALSLEHSEGFPNATYQAVAIATFDAMRRIAAGEGVLLTKRTAI